MATEMADKDSWEYQGVMTGDYAKRRLTKPELRYRLKVRAQAAVEALHNHGRSRGRNVLEFGAADGRTLLEMWTLLDGYGEYDGIEYAEDLIDEAPVLPPNVALYPGDIHELPDHITKKSYDMVTALAVLEHVEDPELVVRNAYEVLEDGGIFVASSPAPFWDDIAGNLKLVQDDYHTVEVTLERLEDWARKAGFSFVTTEPFMWVATGGLAYAGLGPDPETSLKIDRMLSKLPFTKNLFVNQLLVARK